ncbi:MAG: polyphosphate kinase 2 family protein [Tepidisphaeraceae bacterium]
MVDSPYLVKPGKKFKLKHIDPGDTDGCPSSDKAEARAKKNLVQLRDLQEVLYAQSQRSLLVVLQALDAGGKDGTIDHIFSGVNPQGCQVHAFKVPTPLEKAHDFLWRIHNAAPPKGMIGIFNRSHYESVLVERVHNLVPKSVWKERYAHINHFEKLLADEGTTIVKFYLHISRDEQARRMQDRLEDAKKNWKFSPADLEERKLWDDYMKAFDDALEKCSTKHAPWYVVPSDHKWYRNYVISEILVKTLKQMDLHFPKPIADIGKYRVE